MKKDDLNDFPLSLEQYEKIRKFYWVMALVDDCCFCSSRGWFFSVDRPYGQLWRNPTYEEAVERTRFCRLRNKGNLGSMGVSAIPGYWRFAEDRKDRTIKNIKRGRGA